jgi:hypothetical protein
MCLRSCSSSGVRTGMEKLTRVQMPPKRALIFATISS